MIPVVWQNYNGQAPNKGYWDMGFLELLVEGEIWKTAFWYNLRQFNDISEVPKTADGAVVIIPARYNAGNIKQLNDDLKRFEWVLLIIAGDEENVFDWKAVQHKRIKIWVMTPNPKKHADADFVLGEGYRREARKLIARGDGKKPTDIFFCGQITHDRRRQCQAKLIDLELDHPELKTDYTYNTKFAEENLSKEEYYRRLARAKVVPCPSGPATPSSFRLFEALEAGAIPVADGRTMQLNYPDGYWEFVFGGEPKFPVFNEYEQLPGYIIDQLESYPEGNSKVYAWWQNYKRQVAYRFIETIRRLQTKPHEQDYTDLRSKITIVVCSSPISAHPSTEMLEQTIQDIRTQLPECEILIMLDKARPEYKDMQKNYDKYVNRVTWLCNNKWSNVLPIVFEEFGHQSGNTKATLDKIKTPILLFVEHDAPITPDQPIEWEGLCSAILSGEANIIRFHHESRIHPDHEHMMLDKTPQDVSGVKMMRTIQWSQRPHLASVAYYRRMLNDYFSEHAKTMIEDRMHGKVQQDYYQDGIAGWFNHRLWIYTPEGGNIKRSYHTDGRGSTPKYEMEF